MEYKSFRTQKDANLLYLIAIVVLFAFFLFVFTISQPVNLPVWQDFATTEFDATIITEEDGSQKLSVDISTPEQLAGIFTEEEKTYNIYENAKSNNQSKTYAKAKTKIYIAKNVSEKYLDLFFASTYIDHTDISNLKGTTYRLTNNIDLNGSTWAPSQFGNQSDEIGSKKIFDGNGYTISNLNVNGLNRYVGFISYNYGIVKNIKFTDSKLSSTYKCQNTGTTGYMGIVCARNYGSVINCEVSGDVKSFDTLENDTEVCVGGLVGISYGNSYPNDDNNSNYIGLITACTNNANVTNGKYVGGIAGAMNFNAKISYCYNNGKITSTNLCNIKIGGIVGQSYDSTLGQCINDSEIKAHNSTSLDVYTGGIVGYTNNQVTECINKGSIDSGRNYEVVGREWVEGPQLYPAKSDRSTYKVMRIRPPLGHWEDVWGYVAKSLNAYAGGIVGYTTSDISNCKNSGSVISYAIRSISDSEQDFNTSFSVHPQKITSAIAGISTTSGEPVLVVADTSDFSGTVTNSSGKNGDRAYKGDWTEVDNCLSKGKYSKSESGGYAGGIVGYVSGSDVKITSCFNSGAVESNGQMSASYNLNYRFGVNEFTYWVKDKYEYILALNEYISMNGASFKGGISGYGGSLDKCYTTEKYAKEINISITQTVLDYNQVDGELLAYHDVFGSGGQGEVTKNSKVTIDSWGSKNKIGFMLVSKDTTTLQSKVGDGLIVTINSFYIGYQFPIIIETRSSGIYHKLGAIAVGSYSSDKYSVLNGKWQGNVARGIIKSENIDNFQEQDLFRIKQSSTGDGKDGIQKDSPTASDLGDSWIVKNDDLTLKCFYWENSQDSSLTLT